jgi:hypothetical protein
MDTLPPLSPDDRQYEDLRYSPDDFDPNMAISLKAFKKFFVADAKNLLADYERAGVKASRYLRHEVNHPDQAVDGFYVNVCRRLGQQTLTWGNFAKFRKLWEDDWDAKHGYSRLDMANSPSFSAPSE